jgi:hypothetical protein
MFSFPMRTDVSIRGILCAAMIALLATIGRFLSPDGHEMGLLLLFAASLVVFFSSLPDDRVRQRERE